MAFVLNNKFKCLSKTSLNLNYIKQTCKLGKHKKIYNFKNILYSQIICVRFVCMQKKYLLKI